MDYDINSEKIEKQIDELDSVLNPTGQREGELDISTDGRLTGIEEVVENTMTHSHSQDD